MNLSFPPGDLHLTHKADGSFVVTMRGKEILSTKSEPYALHKFNTLRIELEHRSPTREPTAETKAELLRNEVAESIFREQRTIPPKTRIATPTLFEIEAALRSYCDTVLNSDLSEHSQADYINGADNFVRWLKGDFDPGSRVAPYRGRKKDPARSVMNTSMVKAYVNHLTTPKDSQGDRYSDVQFTFNPEFARCYQTRQEAESDCTTFLNGHDIEIDSSQGGRHILKNFRVEERGPKAFVIFCEGPFIIEKSKKSSGV